MASTTIIATGNALGTEVATRLPLEAGVLEHVCSHSAITAPAPNTTWAEISLEQGGQSLANRVAILAAGWVGGTQVISWSGEIHLDPAMHVCLRVWSNVTDNFYCGIKTRAE